MFYCKCCQSEWESSRKWRGIVHLTMDSGSDQPSFRFGLSACIR